MRTTLFASVSIDGFIANSDGIPMFPEHAWADWCALVNEVGACIAGRASVEQLAGQEMAAILKPEHKIVVSTRDVDFTGDGWQRAASPRDALAMLERAGAKHAIIGGGRTIYHACMRDGLVDEVVLDLQPIAFGTGVPLFGGELDPTMLTLVDASPLHEGAMRMRYQVVRAGA